MNRRTLWFAVGVCLMVIMFSHVAHTYGNYPLPAAKIAGIATLVWCSLMFTAWLHIEVLTPRFLLRKKYAAYLLLSVSSVAVLTTAAYIQEWVVVTENGLRRDMLPHLNALGVATFLSDYAINILAITGTSIVAVLREWAASNRQRRTLENEHLAADVARLREQIDPASLLRTLDRAAHLAPTDPEEAGEEIMELSKRLRKQLYGRG